MNAEPESRQVAAPVLAAPGAAVEAATWPALRTAAVGPWRAGLSCGFTRRANSAVLLGDSLLLDGIGSAVAGLDGVERLYASAGLPSVLRLPTARSPRAPDRALVDAIDERGYRTAATTKVLARTVDEGAPGRAGSSRVEVADGPGEEWVARWLGVRAAADVDPEVAAAVLTGCPAGYLAVHEAGEVRGVIRAARVGDWVALSCLAVVEGSRRNGLGVALTLEAARWGGQRGARRAFLQVEAQNAAALSMYDAMGFREVDEYAYRER